MLFLTSGRLFNSFSINLSYIGMEDVPGEIVTNNEKPFLNPTLPPSGVSIGHIYPQHELCNACGSLILAAADNGVFTLLMWEIVPKYETLDKSWTTPSLHGASFNPQQFLKAYIDESIEEEFIEEIIEKHYQKQIDQLEGVDEELRKKLNKKIEILIIIHF